MIKEILDETGFSKLSLPCKITAGWWSVSMMALALSGNMWVTALSVLNFAISSIILINLYKKSNNETGND